MNRDIAARYLCCLGTSCVYMSVTLLCKTLCEMWFLYTRNEWACELRQAVLVSARKVGPRKFQCNPNVGLTLDNTNRILAPFLLLFWTCIDLRGGKLV